MGTSPHPCPCSPLRAAASFAPPPVSTTKVAFLGHYSKPVPSIYNVVVQELLVQQHFMRYATNYEYNEVRLLLWHLTAMPAGLSPPLAFKDRCLRPSPHACMHPMLSFHVAQIFALGLVSTFDQILEQMDDAARVEIFNAYIRALNEDPEVYRRDAAKLEAAASAMTSSDKLSPEGELEVQKALAKIKAKAATGKFAQNKFFSIGLFRLLEITGAKEPAALEGLVASIGVKLEGVNK
jgi:hypothetical protein